MPACVRLPVAKRARRRAWQWAVAAGLLAAGLPAALAQAPAAWPTRPVRLVVPYAAGGGVDFLARTLASRLGERLGQPVVIENRPGASGAIGAEAVAKAPADGYTLLLGDNGTFAVNPALFPKLPYDAAKDFAPVTLVTNAALVLVVNPEALPVRTVSELVAASKAAPKGLDFGSPGAGTPHRLAMELLRMRTGASFVPIRYNGSAPAMPDLLSGRIPTMFVNLPAAIPHLKTGKLRALAVPGAQRSEALPEVPTIAEAGVPGYEATAWQAVVAPAGTPAAAIERLRTELGAVLTEPAVRKRLLDGGFEPAGSSAEELARLMRADTEKWSAVIRQNGITAE